jgi:SAM-dependent methyltransferase
VTAVIVPFNAKPAARYVHPRAAETVEQEGDEAFNLEVASDAAANYLRWVAELCAPHVGESFLDVGAGVGSVTQHLVRGRRAVAIDLAESSVAAMRHRFQGMPNVRVVQADLRTWDPGETFDSVLLVNVLEHIRDDVATLAALRGVLRPGGTVVLYVPALNGLFGSWDERALHFRRYSKWRLRKVLRQAELEPVELRYANFLAMMPWILFSRFSKPGTDGGASLRLWDRTGVPLTRLVESRVRPPIGLNLLGVGQRPRSGRL